MLLPAEFIGMAKVTDGVLDVGGVAVRLNVRWSDIGVYVRRSSDDLSIVEVEVAMHDGPQQEELDVFNAEAERYPLGPKEYWRSKEVGRYWYGPDRHPMTNDEFEAEWTEDDDSA